MMGGWTVAPIRSVWTIGGLHGLYILEWTFKLMLSSVGQDDLEPYEYACEVLHKLFKFKSLSSAQNYLFLAMPHDRSLMFVFLVFHWLV